MYDENIEHAGHTTIEETTDGQWTYTRQSQASSPFPTIADAEEHEMATFGTLGTASYCHVSIMGKKAIEAFLNPFK